MSSGKAWHQWRPTPSGAVAGSLVILGFLLMEVNGGFLALAALGTFGPGILREIGWLRDKDEFQMRAAHRAGYHAYLTAGLVAFLLVAFVRSGDRQLRNAEELATLFLGLLWFTWFFSSLLSYWGARRCAFRTLIVFGTAWGVFNIVGHLTEPVAMAMQLLITTAPFFLLAWLSTRWPRIAGILLLASAVVLAGYLIIPAARASSLVVVALTMVLFVGPLLVSGLALLLLREGQDAAPGREATAKAGAD